MDLDKFKIVYVAPMKALVKEMVDSFGRVGEEEAWDVETEAVRRECSRAERRCESHEGGGRRFGGLRGRSRRRN